MQKRRDGFDVSAVFGDERRVLVRMCGETQRLLERLQSEVSPDLVCACAWICLMCELLREKKRQRLTAPSV